ncbi:MAG: glycosyltransferase [Nocardioides sp.]
MTRVSVVVPSRGGAARLPLLMGSLSRQTHPDWEALVVVDGDVDDSERVLARVARDLPVRVIVLPENRGRSVALNTGFAAATGDVLLRCDDDLELADDHLARHAAHHEAAPHRVGVVGIYRNVFVPGTYARVYGSRADERLRRGAYDAAANQTWRYWAGNASVTAATWERVGPYDLRYRAYGWEDVDWGYRLHRLGVPIRVEPDVEVVHHAAASTAADRALRAYYSGAARRTFEALHAGDGDLPRLLPPPPRAGGVWGALVRATSRVADERTVPRLGAWAEHGAGVLPGWAGEKAVALLVEGSSVAGYRAGRTTGRI